MRSAREESWTLEALIAITRVQAIVSPPRCAHPATSGDCNNKGESSYVWLIFIRCASRRLILRPKGGNLSSGFDTFMKAGIFTPTEIDMGDPNGEFGTSNLTSHTTIHPGLPQYQLRLSVRISTLSIVNRACVAPSHRTLSSWLCLGPRTARRGNRLRPREHQEKHTECFQLFSVFSVDLLQNYIESPRNHPGILGIM